MRSTPAERALRRARKLEQQTLNLRTDIMAQGLDRRGVSYAMDRAVEGLEDAGDRLDALITESKQDVMDVLAEQKQNPR